MPYPSGYLKAIIGGSMPGGEVWSASFGVSTSVAPNPVDIANLLNQLDDDFDAGGGAFAALREMNPTGVTAKTWRGYLYQGGSKAVASGEYTSGTTAFSSTSLHPNQVCAVASLRTGAPGRSRRGRMYLPALGASMGSAGLATSPALTDLANGLATSFGAFNSSGFGKIVVASTTTGAMNEVTQVIVDHVLDTQRRRRDKLVDPSPATATVAG